MCSKSISDFCEELGGRQTKSLVEDELSGPDHDGIGLLGVVAQLSRGLRCRCEVFGIKLVPSRGHGHCDPPVVLEPVLVEGDSKQLDEGLGLLFQGALQSVTDSMGDGESSPIYRRSDARTRRNAALIEALVGGSGLWTEGGESGGGVGG